MKKILFLLAIIPFITFAQSKKTTATNPPLIESITSDTVKGKYQQVLFYYDNSNRVIGITYKIGKISTNSINVVETIKEKQIFEYQDNAFQPYVRKDLSYEYGDKTNKWIVGSYWENYYLYENGRRVGDSVLVAFNEEEQQNWDWKKEKFGKRIGLLKQTNNNIYHEIDLTRPYSAPNVYRNQFKLTAQSNISYEAVEHRYGNRGRDGTYYTFSKVDSKINPLKQLNIANTLSDEKISFYSSEEGNREISWYFVNQNNILDYFVTVDEQSSDFNDIVNSTYSYNQFNQPVHVKVFIKHVWHNGGEIQKKFQKNFTFRYKK
jgi:hypothetical protein